MSDSCCYSGASIVLMANRKVELIRNLRRGMMLYPDHEVDCLVEFTREDPQKRFPLIRITGTLWLTPGHPFRMSEESEWCQRSQWDQGVGTSANTVYNLVLKTGHFTTGLDGVQALTLGHGVTNDPVVTHAWFSSQDCTVEIRNLANGEGVAKMKRRLMTRESGTKLINGW
jgi:hypothetical protein